MLITENQAINLLKGLNISLSLFGIVFIFSLGVLWFFGMIHFLMILN